jgi:hypothetical protein
MLPIHEVETFLQHTPAHLQEIVLELRNVIASVAPDAVEVVRWGGLSYFHAGRGGIVSAGICQIGVHEDHVRWRSSTARSSRIRVTCSQGRKKPNASS